jgi:hypothetical protein
MIQYQKIIGSLLVPKFKKKSLDIYLYMVQVSTPKIYNGAVEKLLSYLTCSQIWLNLSMDDHHFKKIVEKKKKNNWYPGSLLILVSFLI